MELVESAQGTIPKAVSVRVTVPAVISLADGVYTGLTSEGSLKVPVPEDCQITET
jgi:hypothetical protein